MNISSTMYTFSAQELFYTISQEKDFDLIIEHLEQPFFLDSVTYTADMQVQDAEIRYLLDITEKTNCTVYQLQKAFERLRKKNKFERITMTVTKTDNGYALHSDLVGAWTLYKIKVKGDDAIRTMYHQYYLCEQGERFNELKHRDYVKALEEALKKEGYRQAQVRDYLTYNKAVKTVNVTLVMNPGIRFRIRNICISAVSSTIPENEQSTILRSLQKECAIAGNWYTNSFVQQKTKNLKEYLIKKGFFDVFIEVKETFDEQSQAVDFEFRVHLHQRKRFVFFGNHFFSKKFLWEQILDSGRSVHVIPESLIVEEIKELYEKKGFWDIAVECNKEDDRCFFIINEGMRAHIDAINFNGIQFAHAPWLCSKFFSAFAKETFFDTEIFKHALSEMLTWYQEEGFWDAKVLKYSFVPHEKDHYGIEITIDEGEQRMVEQLYIPDYPDLRNQGPFLDFNGTPVVCTARLLQNQKEWLMQYMHQQGFLFAKVYPEIEEHGTRITVTWRIERNDQKVLFGKTILLGTATFPFALINAQRSYNEGDVWSKEQLEKSLYTLRKSGVFETIHAYPHDIAKQEEEKDVLLKLIEDDPFEIRVRAGFQQVSKNLTFRSGSTFKFGGSFLYKNPFNRADQFLVEGDVTRFYYNVCVSYSCPWNFYQPLGLICKGYSNLYIQPVVLGSDRPLYTATQHGFLVGLQRTWGAWESGLNIGIEAMKISGLSKELARAIHYAPKLIDEYVPYFFVEPNVLIDYLNDKINPSQGSLSVLSAKWIMPFDKRAVAFFKILCEESVFMPISCTILGLRVRFGYIFNQHFQDIMPTDRFYLGGENSLRGYGPDLAPPLGVFINDNGKRTLVPQGGKAMINSNIELRFPIPLFKNFWGTLFHDVGFLVENKLSVVTAESLLASTGFGLRYITPIGPLRFEIGWKWKKYDEQESSYAWWFTFGNAF